MSNIIKLWLFTLCFLVTGYAVGVDDCIDSGLNNEITGVNIEIPVRKPSGDLEIYWVDSGEVISKEEHKDGDEATKVRFTVDGGINLCPHNNEFKTLVPARFCNDGTEPDYSGAENIENADYSLGHKLNKSGELDKVCNVRKRLDNKKNIQNNPRRYVDTGIKVNAGDKLSFSLIPRQIKIDCSNDKGLFDPKNPKITLDEIQGKSNAEICMGKFNCPDSEGKETNSRVQSLGSLNGKSYDVLVGNGYTPYDNKVYRDFEHSKFNDSGVLLDLRSCSRKKLTELQYFTADKAIHDKTALCSNISDISEKQKCTEEIEMMKKYSVYELNCFENKICYNQSGIGSDCFSSIRYKKYEKEKNRCNMYYYLDELEKSMQSKTDIIYTNEKDSSWAESLVAKIVSSNTPEGLLLGSQGVQCFPEKNNGKCALIEDNDFTKFSVQLDNEYTVSKVGSVMLAVAGKEKDRYDRYRGGYYVKTRKSCNFTKGEKLYLYIGNNPPQKIDQNSLSDEKMLYHLGGKLNNDGILFKDGEEKNGNIIYAINKSKLTNSENKKIYFGIDVRNIVRDDLISGDTHNKYTVSMSVGRRMNNYVSSIVNNILRYIKTTIIKTEVITGTYRGIAKGLLYSIRAVLTLYIVFSVVGYMLGTMQVGMNDFIIRIVKIACVVLAVSESSWKFFGESLYVLFIDGSAKLIDGFAGYGKRESGGNFGFLDETVGVLFSTETWLKFLSLALAGPFGFIAFLGIIWASVIFLKCMVIAIVRYIIATVLVGFLLTLAPLFMVFILFQTTSKLFTGWIQFMAGVSLQPVIAFSLLSLLSKLLYPIFYNITNFSACYECLFKLNIPGEPCIIKAIWPSGYDPNVSVDATGDMGATLGSLPIDIIQALIYFILANVIESFVGVSETIAEGVFRALGVSSVVPKIARSASQAMLSTVGLDQNTQARIAHIRKETSDTLLERAGRTGTRMNFSNKKDVSGGGGSARENVKNWNGKQDGNSG